LITARQQTLGDRPFANISTLEDYGIRTHGAILNLLIDAVSQVRSIDNEHVRQQCDVVVQKLGAAMGIATHLRFVCYLFGIFCLFSRSMAPLCSRGIVILPADLLALYSLTQESVFNRQDTNGLCNLARDMSNNCRQRLTESRLLINHVPKSHRIALVSASSVDIFLSRLDKCQYDLFDMRLQRRHALIGWKMIWRKMINRY
jgi:phytoene/squalene synthetase